MSQYFGKNIGDKGWFAGGGGGATNSGNGFATINNRGYGNGGKNKYGGGGDGGVNIHNNNLINFVSPTYGKYNTGGGGGGGIVNGWSGRGGSGIVIIRYKKYNNIYSFDVFNHTLNNWNLFALMHRNSDSDNGSFKLSCNGDEIIDIFGRGGGKAMAEKFEVPFLGEIPIDPEIRKGGDNGEPIVYSNPDSPSSKAFVDIAEKLLDIF